MNDDLDSCHVGKPKNLGKFSDDCSFTLIRDVWSRRSGCGRRGTLPLLVFMAPTCGTRCFTLVPNSVIRGRKKPPFLRLLGTVQGLFSQDHEHRLFELSLLRSDFSCLCSKKGVIQLESCCHFIRQQTISAKFVTPGKFSEEVTYVANGDCGVIGWPMTECFL